MKKCLPLPTLISSVFIGMSVSAYGQNPLSPKELEEYIADNAQAIVDAREDRAALQRHIQQLLEENQQLKATVKQLTETLKGYADTKASQAEQAAKAYADGQLSNQITAVDNKHTQAIAKVDDKLSTQIATVHENLFVSDNKVIKIKVFQDRLRDGSLGPKMVVIPSGRFRMGDIQGGGSSSAQPVHSVSINSFAMGQYELTFAEYDKFADATGRSKPNDRGWGRGNRPVINISWHDATAYTNWLSQQTGHTYRLPTEAQWEYAARAGTETKYWWGNDIGSNNANCDNRYCGDSFQYTAPVGSFAANSFGLFDTAGNVWEWTCSEYQNKYAGKEQQCVDRAGYFVLRGGAWNYNATWTRSAYRYYGDPTYRGNNYGFRPARIK